MGILDRLRGMGVQRPLPPETAAPSADDQAIARYRYLLRTAPPETIEQAHAEAFAQLTPEQRRRMLQELGSAMSAGERMAAARAAEDPEVLARMATRAEIRQPGTLERAWGSLAMAPGYGSPGAGGLFAGSFLSSMAGTVLGSMIAQQFFGTQAEASRLFGGALPERDVSAAPDSSTPGPIEDPFKNADAGSDVASGDDFGSSDDFGSVDLGGGDSFDV